MHALNEGLKLMLLGMAGVFLFLIIMVAVISVVAFFFKKYHKGDSGAESGGSPSRGHIAAIGAAVSAYLRLQSRD